MRCTYRKRFVDMTVIRDRMDRKDDRVNRETQRRFPIVVNVALVPSADAGPVVDVALEPAIVRNQQSVENKQQRLPIDGEI